MTDPSFYRFPIFLLALTLMLAWEAWRPFRAGVEPKKERLIRHLGLMALNVVALRLSTAGGAYAAAIAAEAGGWGLFRQIGFSGWPAFASGLLLLDLAIYFQHVVFHKVPWLWRLHRVHHSDISFDTTTAIRFHPIEIVLSMLYKILLVIGVGLTPLTVVVFEAVLNACAQFNHGNVRLPAAAEKMCRWVLITPDLHRIHHSTDRSEIDSNFGFSVPWWDRCFRTYCPAPKLGQNSMEIGLQDQRDSSQLGLLSLLRMPFSRLRAPRD
jgi:sterol desaturase/sphingolipid hydroxylase (fatty acid hydroxylase superfamily)